MLNKKAYILRNEKGKKQVYITYYIKQGLAQNHAEGGDSIYSPMRCERA